MHPVRAGRRAGAVRRVRADPHRHRGHPGARHRARQRPRQRPRRPHRGPPRATSPRSCSRSTTSARAITTRDAELSRAARTAPTPSPPRWPRRTTPSSRSSTRAGRSSPSSRTGAQRAGRRPRRGRRGGHRAGRAHRRQPRSTLDNLLTNLHPIVGVVDVRARRRQPGAGVGRTRLLGQALAGTHGPWLNIYVRTLGPDQRHAHLRHPRHRGLRAVTWSLRLGSVVRLGAGLPRRSPARVRRLAGCGLVGGGGGAYDVTAYFPRAVALYEQGQVRVLGLPAGRVQDVVTEAECPDPTDRRRHPAVRPGRARRRRRRRPPDRRARHARSRSR